MSLSFISLNIEAHRHLDVITKYLKNNSFDVIALQEVYLVHAQSWAAQFGYHLSFVPHVDFTVTDGWFPPLGQWGIAILSKIRPVDTRHVYYTESSVIPHHFLRTLKHPRALLTVKLLSGGRTYTFATTHFTWALPEDANRLQASDFSRLESLLATYQSFILAGDFNAPLGSHVFTSLSQKYHSWVPTTVTSTLDPILFRKPGLNLVVDHLFSTPDYVLNEVQVVSGLSDHCALVAEVVKSS